MTVTGEDDAYAATIGDLLDNFRAGLLAVIPVAERAKINYGDVEPHRDWEQLAESLFDAFVRSPIAADEAADGSELPLARYDIDLDDYLGVSWLAADRESPYIGAVVRFLSCGAPFDAVQVVAIDPRTLRAGERRTVPFNEIRPALYRRSERGAAVIVTEIRAVE